MSFSYTPPSASAAFQNPNPGSSVVGQAQQGYENATGMQFTGRTHFLDEDAQSPEVSAEETAWALLSGQGI